MPFLFGNLEASMLVEPSNLSYRHKACYISELSPSSCSFPSLSNGTNHMMNNPFKFTSSRSGSRRSFNPFSLGRSTSKRSQGMTKEEYSKNTPYPAPDTTSTYSPPPYSETAPPQPINAEPRAPRSTNDTEYDFLKQFDTVFMVDDSYSMLSEGRWKEAEEAIAAITPICTQYDPDGIDIYFLNHKNPLHPSGAYTHITTAAGVQGVFDKVDPTAATPYGVRLGHVLRPYLRRVATMMANTDDYGNLSDPKLAVRPLNIIAITDGVFTDDAESIIISAAQQLDRLNALPWQVGIQFFKVGHDPGAHEFLTKLDDGLCKLAKTAGMRDIVDYTPWKSEYGVTLNGDGILKTVLGGVMRRLDRMSARDLHG